MCEITRETKRKTANGYKVVFKSEDSRYFGFFAKREVKLGTVITDYDIGLLRKLRLEAFVGFAYNPSIIGYSSIYPTLKGLFKSFEEWGMTYGSETTIIRVKIGGKIIEGNTGSMNGSNPDYHPILAGNEILEIKELGIYNSVRRKCKY